MFILLILLFLHNYCIAKDNSCKVNRQFYVRNKFEPILQENTVKIDNNNPLFQKLENSFFAQIGSNPKYIEDEDYHWFDGDGMIHAIFVNNTYITYQNRWIQTKRLQIENKWNRKMHVYFGELRGWKGLFKAIQYTLFEKLNIINPHKGTANTALLYWNKKLYALHEGDKPYELNIDYENFNISTSGRFNDYENIFSTTAHPIIDKKRDLLYLYGYNNYNFKDGKFIFNVFDKNMNLLDQQNISLINNGMIHEATFTGDKMIVPDLPLKYDENNIIKGELPLYFDKLNGTTRFGVFDINDKIVDWYYFNENFFIFHFIKSIEEKEKIKIYACVMENAFLNDFIELDSPDNERNIVRGKITLKELIIDTAKNKTYINENAFIEDLNLNFYYNLDFPVISKLDPNIIYLTIFNAKNNYISGYVKVDITNFLYSIPKIYILKNEHYGNSEPQCVVIDNEEYLLTFSNNYDKSFISLIDVENKNMESLEIKERVPPGFHSIYFKI
jgi:carotenoid cleavage dioxygenase-like enzyme